MVGQDLTGALKFYLEMITEYTIVEFIICTLYAGVLGFLLYEGTKDQKKDN